VNEQAQLLPRASVEPLGEAAALLPGFARAQADTLPPLLQTLWRAAPLRHMSTPGGARMSVAMSNCGPFGWVSDRRGYRYEHCDPHSGQPWPPMPPQLRELAQRAAAVLRFVDFEPDACLINYYAPGTRLTLHQDRDERDLGAPVVSVSCGLPATFLFGGLRRRDAVRRPEAGISRRRTAGRRTAPDRGALPRQPDVPSRPLGTARHPPGTTRQRPADGGGGRSRL